MIVVDSSIWIAQLRNIDMKTVERLRLIEDNKEIIVGDVVLLEVLQGARSEPQAKLIENALRQFEIQQMMRGDLIAKAAANYRLLRKRGVKIRSTIYVIIGTFCIEGNHKLMHNDRDFDPISKHLGLQVA